MKTFLLQLKEKICSLEENHAAELEGMKEQISTQTSDLHRRYSSLSHFEAKYEIIMFGVLARLVVWKRTHFLQTYTSYRTKIYLIMMIITVTTTTTIIIIIIIIIINIIITIIVIVVIITINNILFVT